jgi:poly(hydroxyalkanoate) depolymerase family esterase
MRSLSDTLERLAAFRGRRDNQFPAAADDRLREFTEFGSNPGALRARIYVPPSLSNEAPLVVVLHGCTQTAVGYDHASGWSQLAERQGFALLFPEQQRANNPNLCFNWFAPGDIQRNGGEALSICQMIEAVAVTYRLDRSRIFITGLSAGGAMASAMLASNPELFAGGAIIAGLPYGCASNVPEAFDRMRGHGGPGERELQSLLRNASLHDGPWPTLSIWQGTADRTVDASNAAAVIGQWRAVHGLAVSPTFSTLVDGQPRRVWLNAEGREVIEEYLIAGMGHGTPLSTRGEDGLGAVAPFMLEQGISSTLRIAEFWGLMSPHAETTAYSAPRFSTSTTTEFSETATALSAATAPAIALINNPRPDEQSAASPAHRAGTVKRIIEDALRAAGLMS